MNTIRKRTIAGINNGIIFLKTLFFKKKKISFDKDIQDLIISFKHKKKIVVFCSGPSAAKVEVQSDCLYLATNDGYKGKLEEADFLLFLHDRFAINRILAKNSHFKENQNFIFCYFQFKTYDAGFDYLIKRLFLLQKGSNYFLLSNEKFSVPFRNYRRFNSFFLERNLPIKIQNSGMFLLLFGYYIADMLELPLEIYGLDMGVGGKIHHNSSFEVGKSVLNDRIKENVKMYLDYMYIHHPDIKNYSNFYGNIK